MPSSDKVVPHDQMHWLKTLIFTPLQFIKTVASDQHNYAINIKMIKGVHQLTLRPKMLISLINQWIIFNGWMDGQPGEPMRGSRIFVRGRGPGPYGQSTGSAHTYTHTQRTHARTHTHTHTYIHTYIYRLQTKRNTD